MALWKSAKNSAPNNAPGSADNQPQHGSGPHWIKYSVAVASAKGGVGKSTVAAQLAITLAKKGLKVGLLDADIYGPSQTLMLKSGDSQLTLTEEGFIEPLKTSHGLSLVSMGALLGDGRPVVWRAPMAMKMIHEFIDRVKWGPLDYLIIDLPPGTGDVQLTLAQSLSLAGVVIVSTPQKVAVDVTRRGIRMFQQVRVPILGLVENMSGFTCGYCQKTTATLGENTVEALSKELKVPLLGRIPLDPSIFSHADEGKSLLDETAPKVIQAAVRDLANAVEGQIAFSRGILESDQPSTIDLSSRKDELKIQWPDGHLSVHHPYHLRVNCACAGCVDENTGKRLLDPKRVPLDIKINDLDAVGRYALSLGFSDGHRTGIYSYERLRRLCECEKCLERAGVSAETFSV